MERKLNDLLREIDSLKREIGPQQSGDSEAAEKGAAFRVSSRTVTPPFQFDRERKADIKEVQLYVSRDGGKTWLDAATASPDEAAFTYEAPEDGTYWFTVLVVNRDGSRSPSDPARAKPTLKVDVDTRAAR
jgi:hypothetical protein